MRRDERAPCVWWLACGMPTGTMEGTCPPGTCMGIMPLPMPIMPPEPICGHSTRVVSGDLAC